MLVAKCLTCETSSVRPLDLQLLHQLNITKPGILARIDDIPNITLGESVHPIAQKAVRECLIRAIAARPGATLTINSAYRTIVGQQLLRSHYQAHRCGIVAASPAGKSNHNNASAIDIEDAEEWREALCANGFKKLGSFDPMHYDCIDDSIINLLPLSILAFQQIWNLAYPNDKLALDGDMGALTLNRLKNCPIEGLPNLPAGYPLRTLKLTNPLQSGDDVGKLQAALKQAGMEIEVDRIFGAGTTRAIEDWQRANNLVVDGIGSPETIAAINSYQLDWSPDQSLTSQIQS
jgi:N-acetylmuramoyl-L-alanine amidase